MKILDNNYTGNDDYKESYGELLKLMQIPDIRKIIFRKLAVVKQTFKDVITAYDFSGPETPGDTREQGNLIHWNPREFCYQGTNPRLKTYFDFLEHNPEYRKMVLEEFLTLFNNRVWKNNFIHHCLKSWQLLRWNSSPIEKFRQIVGTIARIIEFPA